MAQMQPVTRAQLLAQLETMKGQVIDPVAGIFGPGSMFWEVGKYSSAFVGAGRAALLQVAHPWVANGIKQHSRTMDDPMGRFRGTFTHVYTMVFGNLDQVLRSAMQVHNMHTRIAGKIEQDSGAFAKGSAYQANEVQAMVWVHATLWETSVKMYELIVGPLEAEQKERYYQESKMFAYLFGIPESALPPDWNEFLAYNERMWDSSQLTVQDAGREIASFVFTFKPVLQPLLSRYEIMTSQLMPPRLRDQFGLPPDTEKNRQIFANDIARIKRLYPRLPRHLRYAPPYVEARRRLRGKHQPDLITGALNKLMLGRSSLVSA